MPPKPRNQTRSPSEPSSQESGAVPSPPTQSKRKRAAARTKTPEVKKGKPSEEVVDKNKTIAKETAQGEGRGASNAVIAIKPSDEVVNKNKVVQEETVQGEGREASNAAISSKKLDGVANPADDLIEEEETAQGDGREASNAAISSKALGAVANPVDDLIEEEETAQGEGREASNAAIATKALGAVANPAGHVIADETAERAEGGEPHAAVTIKELDGVAKPADELIEEEMAAEDVEGGERRAAVAIKPREEEDDAPLHPVKEPSAIVSQGEAGAATPRPEDRNGSGISDAAIDSAHHNSQPQSSSHPASQSSVLSNPNPAPDEANPNDEQFRIITISLGQLMGMKHLKLFGIRRPDDAKIGALKQLMKNYSSVLTIWQESYPAMVISLSSFQDTFYMKNKKWEMQSPSSFKEVPALLCEGNHRYLATRAVNHEGALPAGVLKRNVRVRVFVAEGDDEDEFIASLEQPSQDGERATPSGASMRAAFALEALQLQKREHEITGFWDKVVIASDIKNKFDASGEKGRKACLRAALDAGYAMDRESWPEAMQVAYLDAATLQVIEPLRSSQRTKNFPLYEDTIRMFSRLVEKGESSKVTEFLDEMISTDKKLTANTLRLTATAKLQSDAKRPKVESPAAIRMRRMREENAIKNERDAYLGKGPMISFDAASFAFVEADSDVEEGGEGDEGEGEVAATHSSGAKDKKKKDKKKKKKMTSLQKFVHKNFVEDDDGEVADAAIIVLLVKSCAVIRSHDSISAFAAAFVDLGGVIIIESTADALVREDFSFYGEDVEWQIVACKKDVSILVFKKAAKNEMIDGSTVQAATSKPTTPSSVKTTLSFLGICYKPKETLILEVI